jgi:hypothetical protein
MRTSRSVCELRREWPRSEISVHACDASRSRKVTSWALLVEKVSQHRSYVRFGDHRGKKKHVRIAGTGAELFLQQPLDAQRPRPRFKILG